MMICLLSEVFSPLMDLKYNTYAMNIDYNGNCKGSCVCDSAWH